VRVRVRALARSIDEWACLRPTRMAFATCVTNYGMPVALVARNRLRAPRCESRPYAHRDLTHDRLARPPKRSARGGNAT